VVIYQEPSVLSPPKPEDVNEEYVRAMQAPAPMKDSLQLIAVCGVYGSSAGPK